MCLWVILGKFHHSRKKTVCLARYKSNVGKTISSSSIHDASGPRAFHADCDYITKLVESMPRKLQGVIERV